ncbi:molybdopterin-guanine dinucleotide biosynthesis protein MobA, partial [Xanthomonas hyacinthi DSM 19077]
AAALAARDYAPRALQQALAMACVRLPGVVLGNLNTPQDLDAAGILPAP